MATIKILSFLRSSRVCGLQALMTSQLYNQWESHECCNFDNDDFKNAQSWHMVNSLKFPLTNSVEGKGAIPFTLMIYISPDSSPVLM